MPPAPANGPSVMTRHASRSWFICPEGRKNARTPFATRLSPTVSACCSTRYAIAAAAVHARSYFDRGPDAYRIESLASTTSHATRFVSCSYCFMKNRPVRAYTAQSM